MALEKREPLAQGTELTLEQEDGGQIKFAIERVICYGESSIAYIAGVCRTQHSFANKAVLKEYYPITAPENGIYRNPESGCLILPDHRETDFASRGRELFVRTFPFTGVAGQNQTIYTYTDVNEVITLREWKEEGRRLAGEDIARIMSSVCACLQKVHDRGALYLNCSPESIYFIRREGSAPGEACMFDFDAVKSRNSADYQYHSCMDGWAPIEQYYGEKRYIDVQADVYAAGAVFLWMLTGKKVDIESDHDSVDSSFLWNSFSKFVKDSDANVRIIKKILLNSLHNAWSSRYIHITAMKKDFDRLVRKYAEQDVLAGAETTVYKADESVTETHEFRTEEKEHSNRYYPNGIHNVDYPNGDHYEGEWGNGKFHGNGMYRWKNGDVYEGSWKNGLQDGHGQFKYVNGNVYEGEWKNGQRLGRGKLIYASGAVYEGEWADDERAGNGKLTYASGDVYEGGWLHGKRSGKGRYIHVNGDVYEGEYREGVRDGLGTMTYAVGDVYEGGWLHGKRSGKGRYIYANGDVYEGEYREGVRDGRGTMIYKTGKVRQEEWENGRKKSSPQQETPVIEVKKICNADGSFYKGETLNGVPHGKGKYTYTNGDIYDGEFLDGKRCGHGKYVKRTGEICEGEWLYDKMQGQ